MTGKGIVKLAPVLGALTAASRTALEDMTFEQWAAYGIALCQLHEATPWEIGKWWNAGKPYGDRVEEVRERLALKIETVRQYSWIASNVSIRIDTLTFSHHALVASFKPKEQEHWLRRAAEGGWSVRDMRVALYRERKQAQHKALVYTNAISFDRQFSLIYADPPWRYEVRSPLGNVTTSPENHYETMTVDEICDLMVGERHITEIVGDDAALYLWTTAPLLDRSFEVIERWGFKYKSGAVWDKQSPGIGYAFRGQHEHLLYATRGDMPAALDVPSSVFSYPRGEHSAKPPEIRQTLEKMYPAFGKNDRIELFARGKIPGWTVWGNEAVQDDDAAAPLSPASNVVPVEPKLEESVKELFLKQAQKTQKRYRLDRALKWKKEQQQ